MTHAETAADLLEAVGITIDTGGTCTSGHRLFMGGEYTGPALGTPELDWILLAAGVKRLREANIDRLFTILGKLPDHEFHNAALTLLVHDTPGHALARAIREVNHA